MGLHHLRTIGNKRALVASVPRALLMAACCSAAVLTSDSRLCLQRRGAARRQRFWESAERLSRHGAVDGVAIVALVSGAGPGGGEALVLASQFRPSQGSYVIEARPCADFPGLGLPAAQWPGCPCPVSGVLPSPRWLLVP